MPGLQEYLQQRHSHAASSQRQASAGNFKIPVPVTKLERNRCEPSTLIDDPKLVASIVKMQDDCNRSSFHVNEINNGHGDVYDTDADDVDDTTSTMDGHGPEFLQDHMPQAKVIGLQIPEKDLSENRTRPLPRSSPEQHQREPGINKKSSPYSVLTECASEGYEESEEENKNDAGTDDGHCVAKKATSKSDNPGYLKWQISGSKAAPVRNVGFTAVANGVENIDFVPKESRVPFSS